MQLPLFTPKVDWTPPAPESWPSWEGAKRVCVDVETCDPQLRQLGPGVRRDGYLVGVGVAIEDGPAFYLPFRHEDGGNLDQGQVLAYLRAQAEVYDGEIVGANLQYDADYLAEAGIRFRGTFRDPLLAEALLDELQYSYSLEAVAGRRGLAGKDEDILGQFGELYGVDPKAGLWRLPSRAVGAYAEQDVRLPLKLLRLQEREIERQELWDLWDMECRLQKVLLKMRRRGVAVDERQLQLVSDMAQRREQEALDELGRLSGRKLSPADTNRTAVMAPLFRGLGIAIPRTAPTSRFPNGQDSLKGDYLDTLSHPAANLLIAARKWNKLQGTFVESVRRHATNGRLHCTLNQAVRAKDDGKLAGARYGRLSCANPNLQQQPARDPEIGPIWRKIYVPDEGAEWACLDYCYDAQTEVLTPRGWVRFPDLRRQDTVAQWDGGQVSFVEPTGRYRSPYRHDAVHMHGDRQVDQLVTHNHDFVFLDGKVEPTKVKASQAFGVSGGWRVPQTGILAGGVQVDASVLALAVAIQADGTDRGSSYRIHVGQARKVSRLRRLLAYGLPHTSGWCASKRQWYFTIQKTEELGYLLDGKQFRREALLSLDLPLRQRFFGELMLWDGSTHGSYYCTTDAHNASVAQEVAVVSGWRSNFTRRDVPGRKPLYVVSLHQGRIGTFAKTLSFDVVDSPGLVYCVTVPSGAILVRRNGRVSVSGNSQQEPRWLTHYAELLARSPSSGWPKRTRRLAIEAAEKYRNDPATDNHQMMANLCGIPRSDAKQVYLARCYGMGGGKFCIKLGLPTETKVRRKTGETYLAAGPEGQELLDAFDSGAPFVAALAKACEESAQRWGYIRTAGGRRCRFPAQGRGRYDWTFKALNRLIQGSAGDQMKRAMVAMDDAGVRLQLQVHDEVDFSVWSPEEYQEAEQLMLSALPCNIPAKVDIEIGPTWGEIS